MRGLRPPARAVIMLVALTLAACGGSSPPVTPTPSSSPRTPPVASATATAFAVLSARVVTQTHDLPTAIDWLPDGTMLIAEKSGQVWRLRDGQVDQVADVAQLVPELDTSGEGGLLGLAVAPGPRLFVSYSTRSGGRGFEHLARLALDGAGRVIAVQDLPPAIPRPVDTARHHHGGPVHVRAERGACFVYWIVGDGGGDGSVAQDLGRGNGKLLRFTCDGHGAGRAASWQEAVWAYGIRNSFGFDFCERAGVSGIWETENGQACCDELNFIPDPDGGDANLGWPLDRDYPRDDSGCTDVRGPGWIRAAWVSGTHVGEEVVPTGIVARPAGGLAGHLWAVSYREGALLSFTLGQGGEVAVVKQYLPHTCQVALVLGPDGLLYCSAQGRVLQIRPG